MIPSLWKLRSVFEIMPVRGGQKFVRADKSWKALVMIKRGIFISFCVPFVWARATLIILFISQRQIDITEKVRADNFLPGRTTFQSNPSCGRAVILMSVEHCLDLILTLRARNHLP